MERAVKTARRCGVAGLTSTLAGAAAAGWLSALPARGQDSELEAPEPVAEAPELEEMLRAHAPTHTLAASLQLDYLYIPSEDRGAEIANDGFTTEVSLKIVSDITEDVSASVKVCFACHGLELGMAQIDVHVADELNFRVGRITPSFGEFPVRHDPANHVTSDKPLPYDMGRMLRVEPWNMSVLPVPYVDTGLEVNGTHWFGDGGQIDYAAYVVGGLKGNTEDDFVWTLNRGPTFYFDNNSRPSVGGRLSFTQRFGGSSAVSLGASGTWGTYDSDNELEYWIAGGDLMIQLAALTLRAEYLIRRNEVGLGGVMDPVDRFAYGPGADGNYDLFFLKDGFYGEAEVALGPAVTAVARVDGMRRLGNAVTGTLTEQLGPQSSILRFTLGGAVSLTEGVRLKASVQHYRFSDFEREWAVHTGIVGAY